MLLVNGGYNKLHREIYNLTVHLMGNNLLYSIVIIWAVHKFFGRCWCKLRNYCSLKPSLFTNGLKIRITLINLRFSIVVNFLVR